MRPHDLDSLVVTYGASAVGLETFGQLLAVNPAALRMQRQREPDFPVPVRTGSRPVYRFVDLAQWVTRPDVAVAYALDPLRTQRWALNESASACAATHGADATFRLIAGIALLLAAGWEPDPDESDPVLLAQARMLGIIAESVGPDHDELPEGFVADLSPASDPAVMDRLLRWPDPNTNETTGPSIPDSSTAGDLVATELVRTWQATSANNDTEAFTQLIEPQVALLASRTQSSRPATPVIAANLLVALADIHPGQIVLDPAVGEGNLLRTADTSTRRSDTSAQTVGLVGRDTDERAWLVTKLRFGLRRIAHSLGQPGDDSLTEASLSEHYERILADPGVGTRQMKAWLDRVLELLDEHGIAVVQFPAESVIPPVSIRRKWWDALERHVAAIVIAPASPSGTVTSGIFVMRKNFEQPILFVQVHDRPAEVRSRIETSGARPTPDQIETTATLVRAHLAGDHPSDGSTDNAIDFRPLTQLSLEAFGPPRWHDAKVIRDAVVRSRAPAEAPRDTVLSPRTVRTSPALSARPPGEGNDLRRQAIEAARRLRWLIDHDNDPALGKSVGLSVDALGAFESETTDEMRRALRRLEQRLTGEETRGRKPTRADQTDA